ncbi:MAG TPA: hypothetical protein VJ208_01990 [Candidatus Nanoarchaeia archaeon]|nr:hypothetical protein [Candidatus Nanoarchaeia archaeon]
MTKKKRFDPNEIINSAIEDEIDAMLQRHPRFRGFKGYITKHIDRKRLREKVDEIYGKTRGSGLNEEQTSLYLRRGIADYVASGAVFDEAGQKVILRKGLEEEAKKPGVLNYFAKRRAQKILEGERKFDSALEAWSEIYQQFKSGNYDMPELERPLEYLSKAGFSSTAAEILDEAGLINKSQYRKIKRKIRKGFREAEKEAYGGLEKNAGYQKVAASILGILGIGALIASGASIALTGGVIGIENLENNIAGVVSGILLLISSFVLFLGK